LTRPRRDLLVVFANCIISTGSKRDAQALKKVTLK